MIANPTMPTATPIPMPAPSPGPESGWGAAVEDNVAAADVVAAGAPEAEVEAVGAGAKDEMDESPAMKNWGVRALGAARSNEGPLGLLHVNPVTLFVPQHSHFRVALLYMMSATDVSPRFARRVGQSAYTRRPGGGAGGGALAYHPQSH